MDDFLTICGKRVDVVLLYRDVLKAKARFYKLMEVDRQMREAGKQYDFNFFIFWCVWKSIQKKWFWPFKKPFRSFRKMTRNIRQEEYQPIVDFFNKRILGIEEKEGKEGKNTHAA